ncbi:MAG: hypothetical protein QMD65_00635 [Patescibacteria group bacterium]|nr:hypothetical protein [Patescibacteria group bacterium]
MSVKILNNFFWIVFIVLICFFLQETKILVIGGINPNLILIALLLIIFFQKDFFPLLFSLIAVSVIFLIFIKFWLISLLVLELSVIIFYLFKKFLTGNKAVDFLIGIILISIFYHIAVVSFSNYYFSIRLVLSEIFYNLIFGFILWLVVEKFAIIYEKRT